MREGGQVLRILSLSDAQIAVVATQELARKTGMKPSSTASLATAVSELATNILKYAQSGRIRIRPMHQYGRHGVEVIVEDHGPGISDLDAAMQDNFSTSGTLGLGLPGTKRLVDIFEITSESGKGTRIRLVKWG
jgi:serine/threonine-protein kinase RsbT